ncbi:hypothetical protein WN944_010195 [Citrus x changshan-huyou]|uniref:Uncharacterized protein n=1 Tax=Citrus x changshan-huyou TaxID=2935761 RepID=A0AAP0MTN9_9ROSI
MIVQASGELNFQVMDAAYNPPRRFIVKLETRTCDCGYWEIAASLVNMRWLPLDMQDTELRKALAVKSIVSDAAASQTTIKIPSGPRQSSNTGTRKRRAQVGFGDAGTKKRQSSQGLSQSENPSQALNVTGSL